MSITAMEKAAQPAKPLTTEQIRDLAKESGLDWQKGYMPLFDGDQTNRLAVFAEAIEAHHGIKEQPHTDHPMRHYDRTCPACNKEQP